LFVFFSKSCLDFEHLTYCVMSQHEL